MAQFDWKITQKVEQLKMVPLPWKPAEEEAEAA